MTRSKPFEKIARDVELKEPKAFRDAERKIEGPETLTKQRMERKLMRKTVPKLGGGKRF